MGVLKFVNELKLTKSHPKCWRFQQKSTSALSFAICDKIGDGKLLTEKVCIKFEKIHENFVKLDRLLVVGSKILIEYRYKKQNNTVLSSICAS